MKVLSINERLQAAYELGVHHSKRNNPLNDEELQSALPVKERGRTSEERMKMYQAYILARQDENRQVPR